MSLPRMTFLVNNNHELPEDSVAIRNEENLSENDFFNRWLSTIFKAGEKLNPVALISKNTQINNKHIEKMVVSIFNACPEVGFVYTDALINLKGYEFIDYFSGQDLPDESFFVNLTIPIQFDDSPSPRIKVMQNLMVSNRLFVHIPDPLITVYH